MVNNKKTKETVAGIPFDRVDLSRPIPALGLVLFAAMTQETSRIKDSLIESNRRIGFDDGYNAGFEQGYEAAQDQIAEALGLERLLDKMVYGKKHRPTRDELFQESIAKPQV